jgi:hypothetical protein
MEGTMKNKKLLKQLATIRGIERAKHFKNGGSLHDWRGGLSTKTKNKKKARSKRACRGKFSKTGHFLSSTNY